MSLFLRTCPIVATILFATTAFAAIPTPTTTVSYQLHAGVTYNKYTYDSLYGGYQEIYVLKIDLSNKDIEVGIGVCQNNLFQNTATLGANYKAIAAINLAFAEVNQTPSRSTGFLKAQGKIIRGTAASDYSNLFGYFWLNGSKAGVAPDSRFSLSLGTDIAWGYPILVMNGRMGAALAAWPDSVSESIITSVRARTACGVSKDRSTLYCVVFDEYAYNGKTRRGVTCKNLADWMISLGCHEAWNADGGGSSTMWSRQYGRMNYPQGGTYQRPVYDILFVREKGADKRDNDTGNPSHTTPATPPLLQKPTR